MYMRSSGCSWIRYVRVYIWLCSCNGQDYSMLSYLCNCRCFKCRCFHEPNQQCNISGWNFWARVAARLTVKYFTRYSFHIGSSICLPPLPFSSDVHFPFASYSQHTTATSSLLLFLINPSVVSPSLLLVVSAGFWFEIELCKLKGRQYIGARSIILYMCCTSVIN